HGPPLFPFAELNALPVNAQRNVAIEKLTYVAAANRGGGGGRRIAHGTLHFLLGGDAPNQTSALELLKIAGWRDFVVAQVNFLPRLIVQTRTRGIQQEFLGNPIDSAHERMPVLFQAMENIFPALKHIKRLAQGFRSL